MPENVFTLSLRLKKNQRVFQTLFWGETPVIVWQYEIKTADLKSNPKSFVK